MKLKNKLTKYKNIQMTKSIIITIDEDEFSAIVQKAVATAFENIGLRNDVSHHDDILNVKEVCLLLDISEAGLYRKTHLKEIPFIKNGKKLLFSKTEILQWLKESEQSNKKH